MERPRRRRGHPQLVGEGVTVVGVLEGTQGLLVWSAETSGMSGARGRSGVAVAVRYAGGSDWSVHVTGVVTIESAGAAREEHAQSIAA